MMTWQERLDSVLRSWIGTPWRAGQCMKGAAGGVDCRYFVIGVMDELYGITAPLPARLPQDTSSNNPPLAASSIREIVERYGGRFLKPDEILEPGDGLIVREPGTHAEKLQHGMICGLRNEVWNCSFPRVGYTSMAGWQIVRRFRPPNKESWAKP
jgi:cell wall-associated NlpC family hydrolase